MIITIRITKGKDNDGNNGNDKNGNNSDNNNGDKDNITIRMMHDTGNNDRNEM